VSKYIWQVRRQLQWEDTGTWGRDQGPTPEKKWLLKRIKKNQGAGCAERVVVCGLWCDQVCGWHYHWHYHEHVCCCTGWLRSGACGARLPMFEDKSASPKAFYLPDIFIFLPEHLWDKDTLRCPEGCLSHIGTYQYQTKHAARRYAPTYWPRTLAALLPPPLADLAPPCCPTLLTTHPSSPSLAGF
jgi:hypothetical protein